jgi:hypothetical protein
MNPKRTYRIYREEGLQVRTKQRKKLTRPRIPMEVPDAVNQRWSIDFVSDQLANGRRFRVLNIVDDFSRECVELLDCRSSILHPSEPIEIETILSELPIEALPKAFWVGLPGWMKCNFTPVRLAQKNSALLVNSGPLSLTIVLGSGRLSRSNSRVTR